MDFQKADVEELISEVFVRFTKNNYKIICDFGKDVLPTSYIAIIIKNIINDWFRIKCGRWRSSTLARNLGELAIRVEELMYKYQFTLNEVEEIIQTEYRNTNQTAPSRKDLEIIASRLKERLKSVTFNSDECQFDSLAAISSDITDAISQDDLIQKKIEINELIQGVKAKLDENAQLVFNLYFIENHKLSSISKLMGKNRYEVKQIIDKNLELFRQAILEAGFEKSEIFELLNYESAPKSHF